MLKMPNVGAPPQLSNIKLGDKHPKCNNFKYRIKKHLRGEYAFKRTVSEANSTYQINFFSPRKALTVARAPSTSKPLKSSLSMYFQ